jgi:hypothetical protein
VTIGVSNEIGDSGLDCQNYIAFVIEVVGTLGLKPFSQNATDVTDQNGTEARAR